MSSVMPRRVEDVDTPCLLVDVDRVQANCTAMAERCKTFGVQLRPMMKTHKTVEVAKMMTSGSMRCIECSTLRECEFYADAGFDDILFTGIFTEEKMHRLQSLKECVGSFHVMLDDLYGVGVLERHPLAGSTPWSAFLMVNVGGNRSGVRWDSDKALTVAKAMHDSKCIAFQGLYGHEGHVYASTNKAEINSSSDATADRITQLAARLRESGINVDSVGLGSTPSCSQPGQKMKDINEFHPGNYCFYDAMQAMKGSCSWDDIAARVATRVTGHYPESEQILVDAGFLAVSFDGPGAFGEKGSYCLIDQHPELKMVNMNQECGFIKAVGPEPLDFSKYPIGSLLFLLPWHSCATACAFDKYLIHRGEDIIDCWKPCTGW